jgi:twitching motility protein PilT
MAQIDSFLRQVALQRASDFHISAGNVPLIRYDGELMPIDFRPVTETELKRWLFEILTPEQQAKYERELNIDFVYALEGVARFRANVFQQSRGMAAVFRVVHYQVPTLDDLCFPVAVRKLTQLPNGLVLVTGPTGSGKTTTLAAMVHEINRTSQRHVITIEDPIELVHEPLQSIVTQRQVEEHSESFASALRAALREAPDVVVVGEMRDLETMQLALSAAETGVLVLGTLHTNSASTAIDRIIDVMPEESREQTRGSLSVLLRGVIAQRLCKRAGGSGRVAAMEILLQTFAIANMIRENKLHQIEGLLQSASNDGSGVQSLEHSLAGLVRGGYITLDEAQRCANHPGLVKDMVGHHAEE